MLTHLFGNTEEETATTQAAPGAGQRELSLARGTNPHPVPGLVAQHWGTKKCSTLLVIFWQGSYSPLLLKLTCDHPL